jgi:hypothetical protein
MKIRNRKTIDKILKGLILFLIFILINNCGDDKMNEKKRDKILELMKSRRSIRIYNGEKVSRKILIELVDCARLAPTAVNSQPWEFIIVDDEEKINFVTDNIGWTPLRGKPDKNKYPGGFIIILGNPELNKKCEVDCAFACENILIAAASFGLGTCVFGTINREEIAEEFLIPQNLKIVFIVSIGYPDERVKVVDSDILERYIDEDDTLIVPKRKIEKITHFNKY